MSKNNRLTDEYLEIIRDFSGDVAGRRACRTYMDSSTAIVHHQHVASSFLPKLYDQDSYDAFKYISENSHTILCKVMQHYLDDENYRSIFTYDPRLAELILLPRGYDALLPFARVDVFLNEETGACGFCEFNGDGSSGMNENREITNSIWDSDSFTKFRELHRCEPCELFESWVDEFINIYNTYEHKHDNPHFIICDFLENAVVDEFKVYCDYFAQRGYNCTVADVRDLRFDGEVLRDAAGEPVDAIWRRSVTNDIIDHWEESQQLIQAVRAERVALIGSFAGHIVHDKQIFEALFNPETQAFLTEEENDFVAAHVPRTTFLDDDHISIDDVRTNKDAWIIKPTDNYGANDVYAGCSYSSEEWNDIVSRFANAAAGEPFLVQTYITPFKTPTLPPDLTIGNLSDEEVHTQTQMYNNMPGLYLYNGHFQGIFSRLGPNPVISKPMAGITSATIWVDCSIDE